MVFIDLGTKKRNPSAVKAMRGFATKKGNDNLQRDADAERGGPF